MYCSNCSGKRKYTNNSDPVRYPGEVSSPYFEKDGFGYAKTKESKSLKKFQL